MSGTENPGGSAAPRTVAVVGAGVMGAGVAEVTAEAGHRVTLLDVGRPQLDRARDTIRRGLLARGLLRPGGTPVREILERISFTTDDGVLREADVVLENATEDLAVKRAVHRRIDELSRPDALVAVNTSAIPIAVLAKETRHPDRVVGTHFMNPVPQKTVVEVIRSELTSDEALSAMLDFLRSIGRRAVVVGDAPGFVSNRILMAVVNSAARLAEEGVASHADIDEVFRSCFGHPMGPLETADLIGVDTVVRSLRVLHEFTGEAQYEPRPSLLKLLESGRLGRKSGEGFYPYDARSRKGDGK
ncbi:3-hydroxyacyl-CoA dehydrogenase family protein [Streptomyces sp. NPDC050704]|uniref:3-hydroxyacyl-CoA dehydrogenase family protein n=1 Tax=Streptomyces sp. NPDC050704 TaxID=3157219 RepID=UPI00342A807F